MLTDSISIWAMLKRTFNCGFFFCNCHHPSSGEWFGTTLASQSYLWIVSMRKGQKNNLNTTKKRKKNLLVIVSMYLLITVDEMFFGSSTCHIALPQTMTRNGKPWNVVIKNLLLKKSSFLAVFWTFCVQTAHIFLFLDLFLLFRHIYPILALRC